MEENTKLSWLRNIYIDKGLEFFDKALMIAKNKIVMQLLIKNMNAIHF